MTTLIIDTNFIIAKKFFGLRKYSFNWQNIHSLGLKMTTFPISAFFLINNLVHYTKNFSMINFKVGLSNKSYVFKINNLFVKNIEELAEEINVQTKIQSTFTISKKHIGKLYIWDWKMN